MGEQVQRHLPWKLCYMEGPESGKSYGQMGDPLDLTRGLSVATAAHLAARQ